MTKCNNWRDLPPTKKQLEFICVMQEFVDDVFTGTTRGEAADYISKNTELYELFSADSWHLDNGFF